MAQRSEAALSPRPAERRETVPQVTISIHQSAQATGPTGSSPLPPSATRTEHLERPDHVGKQMTASTSNLLLPPGKKVEQRTMSTGSFPPAEAIATVGAPSLAAQAR